MSDARRKAVFWLTGLCLIAVVAVAVLARREIVERWYIYRLGSEDSATVDHAATRLAEMESTRAIIPLIEQVPREAVRGRQISSHEATRNNFADSSFAVPAAYFTDSAVLMALYDLGAPARESIARALQPKPEDDSGIATAPSPVNLQDLLDAMRIGHSLEYTKDFPHMAWLRGSS